MSNASAAPLGAAGPTVDVTLELGGMSCASCAQNIERTLQGVAGVRAASVNFATERARVTIDPVRVGVDQLVAAVVDAGYAASVAAPEAAGAPASGREDEKRREYLALRHRLVFAAALTLPVRWQGRTLGVLSLLHEAGWYGEDDKATGMLFAALAVPALLVA